MRVKVQRKLMGDKIERHQLTERSAGEIAGIDHIHKRQVKSREKRTS